MRRGPLATEDGVEAERNRILETLDSYKIENELLKKLILKKDAALKAMSTCILDREKNVATIVTEKRLFSKANTDLRAFAR